jgi:hypothetical protein
VLLNMFNAQPFFEDCTFVPWEQRKSVRAPRAPRTFMPWERLLLHAIQLVVSLLTRSVVALGVPQSGVRKEAVLEVKRRSGRAKPVVYHVTDKPPPPKSPVRPFASCLHATPPRAARHQSLRYAVALQVL